MSTSPRSRRRTSFAGILTALAAACLLVTIGVLIVVLKGEAIRETSRIQNGERAEATIRLIEPTSRQGRKSRTYHSFKAAYTFEYQGQTFTGRRFAVEKYETRSAARRDRLLDDLRQRAPLVAYFDPAAPDKAVLDPEMRRSTWVLFIIGVAVGIGGLTAVLCAVRAKFHADDLPVNTRPFDGGYEIRPTGVRRIGVAVLSLSTAILVGAGGGIVIGTAPRPDASWIFLIGSAMVVGWLVAVIAAFRITPRTAGSLELRDDPGTLTIRPVFGRGEGRVIPYIDIADVRAMFNPDKGVTFDSKHATFSLVVAVEHGDPAAASLPGSIEHLTFHRFKFLRAEMEDLVGWLRSQLALPELDRAELLVVPSEDDDDDEAGVERPSPASPDPKP